MTVKTPSFRNRCLHIAAETAEDLDSCILIFVAGRVCCSRAAGSNRILSGQTARYRRCPSRLQSVEMLRIISTSVKLYQASVGGGTVSAQTCMPQLAASALASRSFSMTSLREWAAQSALGRTQVLGEPCVQPSIFALQVSNSACSLTANALLFHMR